MRTRDRRKKLKKIQAPYLTVRIELAAADRHREEKGAKAQFGH